MTIAELRSLLGALGEGKTDKEVEQLQQELVRAANAMFDHLQAKLRDVCEVVETGEEELPGYPARSAEQLQRDALENVRWTAYMHEHTDEVIDDHMGDEEDL